jgi:YidC/Oxa1 family membrane protein insertase
MMELYKKEKVSPASGCLPLLLQLPVFIALYKVFFVSIEMRQAPFFGWVQDLSVKDPTSVFNLFGLIPFDPPSFLMIGAWPLIWVFTMLLQQKISPAPTDPTQQQVMKIMPWMMLMLFASMPAGLVIYWTFSNCFTIAQQLYFLKHMPKHQ